MKKTEYRIFGIVTLAILVFFSGPIVAQTPTPEWGSNGCGQRLYYIGTPNNEFRSQLNQKGLTTLFAIYDHDRMQNLDNLDKWISQSIQDSLTSGYVMLNLENDFYDNTWDPAGPKFKESVQLTLTLLARAKKMRPYIKWSIYKCPQLLYFADRNGINEKIRTSSLEIMKELDWLCPEFYEVANNIKPGSNPDAYQNSTFDMYFGTKKRMEVLLKFCAENGITAEVSALVWPRFYVDNRIMENVDFETWWKPGTISGILDAEYNGKKIDFITMWDADYYFIQALDITYAGYNDSGLILQKELRDNDVSYFDQSQKQAYLIKKLTSYLHKLSDFMEEKCTGKPYISN